MTLFVLIKMLVDTLHTFKESFLRYSVNSPAIFFCNKMGNSTESMINRDERGIDPLRVLTVLPRLAISACLHVSFSVFMFGH